MDEEILIDMQRGSSSWSQQAPGPTFTSTAHQLMSRALQLHLRTREVKNPLLALVI